MKTRWKILIGAGIFLVLAMASAWITAHHRPEGEVEAYKKFLRDRGEKLEISEVVPPPVPEESNSLNAVEGAFGMFGSGNPKIPEPMKMVAPGKAMIGWSQPEARGYDFTNSWDDLATEAAADDPAIELLHEVLRRPRLDFELDYKQGAYLPMTHLAPFKRVSQKLAETTIIELHNGDTGAAATNILTMLALVQRNQCEGLLISHLVRIAMAAIVIGPTWEFLQATNATDAQLAGVQTGWEQMDFLSDATNVFAMERAWDLAVIQRCRGSHEEYQKEVAPAFSLGLYGAASGAGTWPWNLETITEKPRYALVEAMWRSSWSYADEMRTLKSNQIILEALRTMQTNQSQFYKADFDAMVARMGSLGITNTGAAFFQALKIPDMGDVLGAGSLGGLVRKTLRMVTGCRVAIAATALKRFQLKHGNFPDTLDQLVPDFLQAVPIDPYAGKPLLYRPNTDGTYLLYSVGDDGKDDGGTPASGSSGYINYYWQNDRAPDWVWPQPATAAEIQFFYEHPPK